MVRASTVAIVAALVLSGAAGCGDDDALEASTTTTVASTTTEAEAAGATTTTAEPTTTTGGEAAVTTTAAADPSTTTTEAPPTTVALDITALSLAGVTLDAAAEPAVRDLIDALGPPTEDTGWTVGCPLDGEDPNERYVSWGSLTAYFVRTGASGSFAGWWYGVDPDTLAAAPGGPEPGDLTLPGDLSFGDPIGEAESRLGVPVVVDEDLFFIATATGSGWELSTAFPALDAPIVTAASPFQPVCE